jgi:hypothetical protein
MISFFEASLLEFSVHKVGNKLLDESLSLSSHPLKVNDEILDGLLMNYFLKPFEKAIETYRFYHPTEDLHLNEVFHFAEIIFNNKTEIHKSSQEIAKHLYDMSNHPKIKSGELYVCYFANLQVDGELLDAIGIFKSESKEPYLKVIQQAKEFEINYEQEAINIKKLDKGCLIFNVEKEEGYRVAIVDQTNSTEAAYWIDDFLKLKIRNDNYTQTNTVLKVYKDFVTRKIDDEFEISKTDKIDLLNRSIKYFKEKEHFDFDEFSNEVLANEQGIKSFKKFKSNYEDEYDTAIGDSFLISDSAVKRQARAFKSVLKLDKNFHIYIHGNKELIEKGYDEQMKMNYYKVFFREEA